QRGRLGAAVGGGEADEDVVRPGLGVLGDDVEITAGVEHRGVQQLELRLELAAPPVLPDQPVVGEGGLGGLVEGLGVGGRRRGVEVEVTLLDVLAVVALRPGQPEEAFLEDAVAAVPQRQGEAQPALAVADAEQAVLAPAVGPAAGVVVREIVPGVAGGGIVLTHRPPLAFGQVRAPAFPVGLPLVCLLQAGLFGGHGCLRRAISCFKVGELGAGSVAVTPETSVEPLAQVETRNSPGCLRRTWQLLLTVNPFCGYLILPARESRRLRHGDRSAGTGYEFRSAAAGKSRRQGHARQANRDVGVVRGGLPGPGVLPLVREPLPQLPPREHELLPALLRAVLPGPDLGLAVCAVLPAGGPGPGGELVQP